ncbi:hypothetical protein PsorP6_012973 [Peronosclerospora sorghi]|uniref:Uncharacterized protein n=1 Tax=Peronosclerospora sorghi TaxID=230839 RepID=A0ACC0WGM8_9STRA|nr:hypothetical protein PsorP6_012973 [Peronosclerospora sorghi]
MHLEVKKLQIIMTRPSTLEIQRGCSWKRVGDAHDSRRGHDIERDDDVVCQHGDSINSGFVRMGGMRYNHGDQVKPHNVPLVLIGATLIWFGWFGLNAGSQGEDDGGAAIAAINTNLSPCAGFLTWSALEFAVHKKFDSCGAVSGAVAGLVATTTWLWLRVSVRCCDIRGCGCRFRLWSCAYGYIAHYETNPPKVANSPPNEFRSMMTQGTSAGTEPYINGA